MSNPNGRSHSLPIQQPLACGLPDRGDGPLPVRGRPVIPAEAEFVAVAVEMLLRDMVEGPMHTPLEQGEEGLGGVDMDLATDILALGVRDRLVSTGEPESDPMIGGRIVGYDLGALMDALLNSRLEIFGGQAIHDASVQLPMITALHQGDDRRLSLGGTTTPTQPRLPADIGFINFDHAPKQRLHRLFAHSKPNAMGQMPCRLVGPQAEIPLQLERRDALLVGAH